MTMPPPAVIECRLQAGTQTAGRFLQPVFDSWARTAGIRLFPGTANGCAATLPDFPTRFLTLRPHANLLALEGRRNQQGDDPRLFPVPINGAVLGWVFRWSADDVANGFVGGTEHCQVARYLEIVSLVSFRHALGLRDGDAFQLSFM